MKHLSKFCFVLAIILTCVPLVAWIKHPELTAMQLFVNLGWYTTVSAVVLAYIGVSIDTKI